MAHRAPLRTSRRRQYCVSVNAFIAAAASVISSVGLVIAGLLVGFGTRMGHGCTSGHGVTGLGRLSLRSLVVVLVLLGLRRRDGGRHSPPGESTSMNKALFFAPLAGALSPRSPPSAGIQLYQHPLIYRRGSYERIASP